MRVLWFTNVPMPKVYSTIGIQTPTKGAWMWCLLEELKTIDSLKLGVAVAYPGLTTGIFDEDNIRYYTLGQTKGKNHLAYGRKERIWVQNVVDRFKPDIVHVHGSERFYFAAASTIKNAPPLVISIQGLLTVCRHFYFKGLKPLKFLKLSRFKQVIRLRGPLFDHLYRKRAAAREKQSLRCAKYFIGRTEWDKAWVKAYNPNAKYFKCDEIIRNEFNKLRWDINTTTRYSLLFTSAMDPLKGIFCLIEALRILHRNGYPASLTLAGSWDPSSNIGRIIKKRLVTYNLIDHVKFVGFLESENLAKLMKKAHVFVSPSYIDNSPNSLSEAMMIGTPCVASFVGGVPSILQDGVTGLMFPAGDPALLASKIQRIFDDDNTAVSLSKAAHNHAKQKHDNTKICNSILAIYNQII